MEIPSQCKMPDLSGLDFPLVTRLLVQLIVGERNLSRKAALYRRNFVRLVDKALRQYYEAREVILAEIAEANRPPEEMVKNGRYIYCIAFTNHIETCINAVSRLFRLLERIKSETDSPSFPRELRRLLETKSKSIANVRNSVEHIDEQIQKDEITPGNPIMLSVNKNNDGVIVSNFEIKFKDLAIVLEKMHEIALYLLTLKTQVEEPQNTS